MKKQHILFIGILLLVFSCGKKTSRERQRINDPENGYIQELNTDQYNLKIQYQTPEYRADQEIMLNKSTAAKNELVAEYDQLQQFLVQLKTNEPGFEMEELGLMDKFSIVLSDTIPCIDAHALPYSPGAPYYEVILLFPVSQKELGKEFKMVVHSFPFAQSKHEMQFRIR